MEKLDICRVHDEVAYGTGSHVMAYTTIALFILVERTDYASDATRNEIDSGKNVGKGAKVEFKGSLNPRALDVRSVDDLPFVSSLTPWRMHLHSFYSMAQGPEFLISELVFAAAVPSV